ncbi:MAG: MFS transporter [Pseudonocardiaceae bacterium]|nr:MFS transporter [Pseudonocardiaceae bacterium]
MVAPGGAVQRRAVRVLSATQVLGGIGVATGVAFATLIAASISGSETVGGLALTAVVVGAAVCSLPIARLAARAGRRPALLAAYCVAAAGAGLAALGAALGSTTVLLVGLLAFGGGTAAGLAARYAATDLARPDRRARDLSVVVWATTVGSVLGPNLAGPAQRLATISGLDGATGPFLLAAVAFGLAALLVAAGLRPDPLVVVRSSAADGAQAASDRGAGWRALRASPTAQLALTGIVLSHLVMVGLMSMTPVHLDHGGATLRVVGIVISLHIAGMYALSPVIGWLADRIGRVPVLATGALLLAAAAGVAGSAPSTGATQLSIGLVLLGLGWSCGLVAGSALVTESVPVAVRPGVQGISDLAMNSGGALGGVLAGTAVAVASYEALALIAGLLVLPFLAVAVSTSLRARPA